MADDIDEIAVDTVAQQLDQEISDLQSQSQSHLIFILLSQ